MGFSKFKRAILFYVCLILVTSAVFSWMGMVFNSWWLLLNVFVAFSLSLRLYQTVARTNRKLTRFIESIEYNDFTSGFLVDSHHDPSIEALNVAITKVLDKLKTVRAERELNALYLKTVVQHLQTGLVSYVFSPESKNHGNVDLLNKEAQKILGVPSFRNISDLESINPEIYKVITSTVPGSRRVYKEQELNLIIQVNGLKMNDQEVRLVGIYNVTNEIQNEEVEAWQNLTKVLRHEIMNSLTPIISISDFLNTTVSDGAITPDVLEDVKEGIQTVHRRSKSLNQFIQSYRSYTNLPEPVLKKVSLITIIDATRTMLTEQLELNGIKYKNELNSNQIELHVDPGMIEMVFINIFKNSIEALKGTESPYISVAYLRSEAKHEISFRNNGPKISEETLKKIFIPFYTTKNEGTGVGLSLSRQIIHMHNGQIQVKSTDQETTFVISLPE